MDSSSVKLRKGLFLRRLYYIPLSSVVACECRRTLLLRIFGAKKITLYTLSGEVSFYLKKTETLPFFPSGKRQMISRPRLGSVLLGAFCETKAFSGAAVFSAVLTRIGSISQEYLSRIVALIENTAVGISDALDRMSIFIPRAATLLAVFVAAAWIIAYIRNVLKYLKFTLCRCQNGIAVSHGVITLYERLLVPNNLGIYVIWENASTMLFKSAPIYCHRLMALPPMKSHELRNIAAELGLTLPAHFSVTPPKRALFGHIAVPFGWGIADIALLVLCRIFGKAPMLQTLLWIGVILCIWYCVLYGIYMRKTGYTEVSSELCAAARHGTNFVTVISSCQEEYRREDISPPQRFSKMCDVRFYFKDRVKLRLRNMQLSDLGNNGDFLDIVKP